MNTYSIDVTITFRGTVEVQAESKSQAAAIVQENFRAARISEINDNNHPNIEDWDIQMIPEIDVEDIDDDEDEGGDYNGNGFTFNLDTEEYLEKEGLASMPEDMWEGIIEDVEERALSMMKEGYRQGELCVSYNGEEFYGWWYSK